MEKFEHGGTFITNDGVVHSFGYGISPTSQCGISARDQEQKHDGQVDDVTCPLCIAAFPGWLIECIKNPLVKTEEGYYVHWRYLRYGDTGKLRVEDHKEHVCAIIPSYHYDEKYKKWAFNFSGADLGGYDVQNFTFYFDSEEDILKCLKKEKKE